MSRRVSSRGMLPCEHGAYAQLGVPLAAAFAASRATPAGVAMAISAFAVFVSHEPALVVLGHRGTRARRESASAAVRWLCGLSAVALAAAAYATALDRRAALWLALPCAGATIAAVLVAVHRERTLFGEVLTATALASAAVPVAVAGGVECRHAVASWAAFAAAFAVSTVEVRRIARRAQWTERLAVWLAASFVLLGVAASSRGLAVAPIPVVAVLTAAACLRTRATALRPLGWALAVASLATALAVVFALRRG